MTSADLRRLVAHEHEDGSELMATYVLIPGAGGSAWLWHLVQRELEAAGHEVLAVDLPAGDDRAGLAEYCETVVAAIGDRVGVIVVALSMGGFTAPMVAERAPTALMVLVNAMTPRPGESPDEWWANTGHEQARRAQAELDGWDLHDSDGVFFHDVPAEITAEALRHDPPQSSTPFEQPWPVSVWPAVPTRFLLSRDDRFFPADFQRRIVRERLGIVPEEIDGGHLTPLSRPREVAAHLDAYRLEYGIS